MNPFGGPRKCPTDPVFHPLLGRLDLLVLVMCVVFTSIIVPWRAILRASDARARARTNAAAVTAALELQLSQASAALEVFSALANQTPGGIQGFQKAATDLLAQHPRLASLEVAPRGIVSDIVPRAGSESAIGFNVFGDIIRRIGANTAIQQRAAALAGPLRLYSGEPGVTVLLPLSQRGRDGRTTFWGFVGASVRTQQLLDKAEFGALTRKGYSYSLTVSAPGQTRPSVMAEHGEISLDDAVQQPLRFCNVELRLALQPRQGWTSTGMLVADLAVTLAAAALLFVSVWIWGRWRDLEIASSAMAVELARSTEDRKQAQEECRREQARAAAAETALAEAGERTVAADGRLQEANARLEERDRSAREAADALAARLKQAEARAGELQIQLDSQTRAGLEAARAQQKQLADLQAALQQSRQAAAEAQARLDSALRAQKEAAISSEDRSRKGQATIAGLESQLQAARQRAERAASSHSSTLQELEAAKVALEARLAEAESQVGQLMARFGDLERKAQGRRETPVDTTQPPAAEPEPANAEKEAASAPIPVDLEPPAPDPSALQEDAADRVEETRDGEEKKEKAADDDTGQAKDEKTSGEAVTNVEHAPRARGGDKRKRTDQMDLWPAPAEPPAVSPAQASAAPAQTADERNAPPRHLPAPPPVKLPDLRKAVHDIVPLLSDQDPGARDCLKANRTTFRSAFTSEGYVEFEQSVKTGEFTVALDQLRKAAKKHGISV